MHTDVLVQLTNSISETVVPAVVDEVVEVELVDEVEDVTVLQRKKGRREVLVIRATK